MNQFKIDLPVLAINSDGQNGEPTSQRELVELPEWLHCELKTRAKLQWEAMQPVMGYNKLTKNYHPAKVEEGSVTQAHVDIIKTVKALYEAPIYDPQGNPIDVTKEIFAWWDEYSIQCSVFPEAAELEEAQALVANYFQDDKRFTMGRWFSARGDQLKEEEERELGQLN